MRYDFDKNIAKEHGVEEAIMYENIAWWCHKNASERSEVHFHDGHYWTWNTEEAWSDLFGFWTGKQCSRILSNLEKAGLLATGMFNKKGYDRTKWFRPKTPVYTELEAKSPNGLLDKPKRAAPSDQTGAPIPDSINTDNTKSQGVPRPPKKVEVYENTEDIPEWQTFPPATTAVFTALYELGWKLPKSRDIKKMRDDLGDHLRLCGLLYKNAQGYEQLAELEMKTEARRFVTYWQGQQELGKGKKDYWATFLNRCNQIHEYRTKKSR